jgi:hypothetical protein
MVNAIQLDQLASRDPPGYLAVALDQAGRLCLTELGSAAALRNLVAAGELFTRLRSPSPMTAPWRSTPRSPT